MYDKQDVHLPYQAAPQLPVKIPVSSGLDHELQQSSGSLDQHQAMRNCTHYYYDGMKSRRSITAGGLTGHLRSQASVKKLPLPSASHEDSSEPAAHFSFLGRGRTVVPSLPQPVCPPSAVGGAHPLSVNSYMERRVQKLMSTNATAFAQSSPAMRMMMNSQDRGVRRKRRRWDEFVWSNVYPLLRTTHHYRTTSWAARGGYSQLTTIQASSFSSGGAQPCWKSSDNN